MVDRPKENDGEDTRRNAVLKRMLRTPPKEETKRGLAKPEPRPASGQKKDDRSKPAKDRGDIDFD